MQPVPEVPTSMGSINCYLRATASALASRSSLAAIAILLINDHFLKTFYPSWVTGKLSDFAGLYVAPVLFLFIGFLVIWLVQLVPRPGERSGLTVSRQLADTLAATTFSATAVVFTAAKLSVSTSESMLDAIGVIAGQRPLAVADPSDLVALAIMPAAYCHWRRWMEQCSAVSKEDDNADGCRVRSILSRLGQIAVVLGAAFAVMATSSMGQPAVIGIAADPRFPNVLYATVGYYLPAASSTQSNEEERYRDDPVLFRTIDAGVSWQRHETAGERTVPDPFRQGALYAIRLDSVWRFDGDWMQFRSIWPPPGQEGEKLGIEGQGIPVDVPLWKADVIYVGVRGTVMRSYDSGDSWSSLPLPSSPDRPVTALASAPSEPGLLFACQEERVFRSEDWGNTWVALPSLDVAPTILSVDPRDKNVLLEGTATALARSIDAGVSWRTVWSNGSQAGGPVSAILFDPYSKNVVYAAVKGNSLLVSTDGGASWKERMSGDVRAVTVTGSRYPRVFVAAGFDGVYRQRSPLRWPWLSEWEHVNSGLGAGSSGFPERIVNLGSWLALLFILAVAGRSVMPSNARLFVLDHPWESSLGIWCVIPILALFYTALKHQQLGETLLLVSLPAVGIVVILSKAPLSWATWGIAGVEQLLVACLSVIVLPLASPSEGSVFGFPVQLAGLVLLLLGFTGSAALMSMRGLRLAKEVLVTAIVLANLPYWAFMALGMAFAGMR